MRVRRAVYVSEENGNYTPRNEAANLMNAAPAVGAATSTIDPGGRKIRATVSVVFELE